MAKKETVVESIKMSDGSVVDFPGERKMKKEFSISADNTITCKFAFRNGEIETFTIPQSLILQCAGHGALQKIGDEASGETEVGDMHLAIQAMCQRLSSGRTEEWTKRQGGGSGEFKGASILLLALRRAYPNQDPKVLAEYVKGKSPAERAAAQRTDLLKEHVAAVIEERDRKKGINPNALESEMSQFA